MFHVNIANTICSLKEALIPEKAEKIDGNQAHFKGLIFPIDLRLAYYNNTIEANVRKSIYFLLCGNTSVWVASPTDEERWYNPTENIPLKRWQFLSNHDSCWRSAIDDELSRNYFAMAKALNGQLKKTPENEIAPCNFTDHSSLGIILSAPFFPVLIVREQDYTDNFSYRQNVVSVSPRDL